MFSKSLLFKPLFQGGFMRLSVAIGASFGMWAAFLWAL